MIFDEAKEVRVFIESLGQTPPFKEEEIRTKLLELWENFIINFLKKDERFSLTDLENFKKLSIEEKIESTKNSIFKFDDIFEIYTNAQKLLFWEFN